jgi:hypothetical protein
MQTRRTDVEDDVQTSANGDYVTLCWNRPAGPGGWIRPQPSFGRRRTLPLRFGALVRLGVLLRLDAGAYPETGWNEQ